MSPNDNGGPEDFVLIDDPTQITSSNGDTSGRNACNSPVEPDYVTVDSIDPTISAEQKVVLASTPVGRKQPTVQIEYFEPMFLSDFPYRLTEEVLMAPIPSKYQAPKDEVNMPHSTADPQSVFVTNANLLLECFFHFEGLHPKIGRDLVFYTVGKACELRAEQAGDLQQHVDCIFDILRERRMAFLRRTEGTFILRAEDHNVRELARLVDRYINLDSEEPQEVEEKWYMNPVLHKLWFEWQDILQNKGLRITKGPRKTGEDKAINSKGALADIFHRLRPDQHPRRT